MNNLKKIIAISLLSFLSFGNDSLYDEILNKIHRSFGEEPLYEWRIYINADKKIKENGKLVESLENYTLPDMQFYSTPDLKGKPVAHIDSKGYYEDGDLICNRERASGNGKKKAFKYDLFFIPGELGAKTSCPIPPIRIVDHDEGPLYFVLHLKKIEENIGHVRIGRKIRYMDISQFKGKPIVKPMKERLREVYGEKDFLIIDGIISKLRNALINEDVKTLNEFFYRNCIKEIGLHLSKKIQKSKKDKCKSEILTRDLWHYKKSRMLYTLFYEIYDSQYLDYNKNTIYLLTADGAGIVFNRNRNKKWMFSIIETEALKNFGIISRLNY